MNSTVMRVLLVGGTGSIGRHVAEASIRAGHQVRVLSRRAVHSDAEGQVVIGDLTETATLAAAVAGIDAVVFTHGTHGDEAGFRDVDYGGVRNVLTAIGSRPVRISLMTAIGVTNRGGYNALHHAHDWKRRSERLVRASGHDYTIVRPGWFDHNSDDQHRLRFLQGDRRWAGSPADGVIARSQIADVLVAALTTPAAVGKTFELVAEHGPAQTDLEPLFAQRRPDTGIDGVGDTDNLSLRDEPAAVAAELEALRDINIT